MLVLLLMSLKMVLHVCSRLIDSVEELGGAVHGNTPSIISDCLFSSRRVIHGLSGLCLVVDFVGNTIFLSNNASESFAVRLSDILILAAFTDHDIIPRSDPGDHLEEVMAKIRPQQSVHRCTTS